MTKKKEPKLHRKEFTQFLEYEFTQKELLELSKELCKKMIEISEVERRRKSAMSQFKSELDKLVEETNEISRKVNAGSEERNIKCEALFFYDKNEKHVVRMDNGLVIWNGEIPEHERQIESFDKTLDKELELDDKAHEELLGIDKLQNEVTELKEEVNTTLGAQSPDTEPDTPETSQSSNESAETPTKDNETVQEEFKQKVIEETQAELDAEDAGLLKKIEQKNKKDPMKIHVSGDSSIPPLPNE